MLKFFGRLFFRIFSLAFIFSCLLMLLFPTNKNMAELAKEDYPLWVMKLSQLWGNSVSDVDKGLDNRTTLQWAAARSTDPDVISFLVQSGVDINQSFETSRATPLQFALEQNKNSEITKRLLELGANPNLRLEDGRTLFHVAVSHIQDKTVLDSFKQHGADIFAVDTANRANALHWAADHNDNLSIIQKLISMGFEVEGLDGVSRTPLMKAATKNNNPDVIKYLLSEGAFVNARDQNWDTALIRGCRENKNPEVLMILLENGADVNLFNNQQKRAIDYARQNKALEGSEFLFKLEILSH